MKTIPEEIHESQNSLKKIPEETHESQNSLKTIPEEICDGVSGTQAALPQFLQDHNAVIHAQGQPALQKAPQIVPDQ